MVPQTGRHCSTNLCVYVCFCFRNFIIVFCITHIFTENFFVKSINLLKMNVNLCHEFYTSEWKFTMMFKVMQCFKDVNGSDLYCSLDALVFKDIYRRYNLCSSFSFSFPRVLISCLCNFCLNPLFWFPADLGILCAFLGTGALVFLMLPCIFFPPQV